MNLDEEIPGAGFLGIIVFIGILIVFILSCTPYQRSHPSDYNGTYCKAGYVFIDEDAWHGNSDQQLRNENGGGVPCNQEK